MYECLDTHGPFKIPELRNNYLGVVADPGVNVDNAKTVSERIIDSMTGRKVASHVMKKKNQVVTM